MKKQTKFFYAGLVAAVLSTGCFSHREAPERFVSAKEIAAGEAISNEVESLDLSGFAGGSLPQSLASMPKLKVLYLRDGAFSDYGALGKCAALQVLDLGDVKLGALPSEVLELQALRVLYLSGCGLEAFPADLESLPELRYLNLDRNRISTLPEILPPHLRWLRLNSNMLAELPAGIGGLRSLQRLYLRGNRLTGLPEELAQCAALTDIDLAQNNLAEFPAILAELPALRNLDLSGNTAITSLPGELTLSKMWENLRTLRLTGCPLSDDERARIRAALHPQCAVIF